MSQEQPATLITNDNIRQLITSYVNNKSLLPQDLRDIPIGEWDDHHFVFDNVNVDDNVPTFGGKRMRKNIKKRKTIKKRTNIKRKKSASASASASKGGKKKRKTKKLIKKKKYTIKKRKNNKKNIRKTKNKKGGKKQKKTLKK